MASLARLSMRRQNHRDRLQRGSAMVEVTLVTSLFLIPLLFGTIILGLNLIREIEVTEVCRDAAHMYAFGIDFSQSSYQNLLVDLAQGLNFSTSGGNGVVILSTVTFVGPNDCTAAGYQANTSSCPNMNQTVFTRRIVVGNSSLRQSGFGTPNSGDMDSEGDISASTYLTDTSTRAVGFSSLIPLTSGQFAYMSEMYLATPDLSWWNYLGTTSISARSIF